MGIFLIIQVANTDKLLQQNSTCHKDSVNTKEIKGLDFPGIS